MTVQGLDRLNRKLARLPVVAEKRIRAAMEKVAADIVAMARRLCPVDSGALRDSIDWTWGKTPKGAIRVAAVNGTNGLTLTIYAGDREAYYAAMVEFGTSAHEAGGRFKGAMIPAIPASPYFYVSYRALRRSAKSRISRSITAAAKEVAAGG